MNIFPAIDLYDGKAVRLYQGDYNQMTVYDEDPLRVARTFVAAGAAYLHTVDLEGAKTGGTPNLDLIRRLAAETGLFVEVGGGIRSMEVIDRYLSGGVGRVILGTAAVTDESLLRQALDKYGEKIAVGADLRDGCVAIKGWTEGSGLRWEDFFEKLEKLLNLRTFRIIVLCALCFYSGAKCYSFFCGANHLQTIFTTGVPGRIFSAGLILPLNVAVGIVVACTMYGFYSVFQRGRI